MKINQFKLKQKQIFKINKNKKIMKIKIFNRIIKLLIEINQKKLHNLFNNTSKIIKLINVYKWLWGKT